MGFTIVTGVPVICTGTEQILGTATADESARVAVYGGTASGTAEIRVDGAIAASGAVDAGGLRLFRATVPNGSTLSLTAPSGMTATWSAIDDPVFETRLSEKLNEPAEPGESGDVLSLDETGDPVWTSQSSGAGWIEVTADTLLPGPGNYWLDSAVGGITLPAWQAGDAIALAQRIPANEISIAIPGSDSLQGATGYGSLGVPGPVVIYAATAFPNNWQASASINIYDFDQSWSYTGAEQTLIVLAGFEGLYLNVYAAGAGGAGGSQKPGGAGGGVEWKCLVQTGGTIEPGSTLKIVVGRGGLAGYGGAGPFGGGRGGSPSGACGGDYSGVFLTAVSQANALAIAGGGGGGAENFQAAETGGGFGGGTVGGDGRTSNSYRGYGGSQTAGGAAGYAGYGATAGAALQGGAGGTVSGNSGGGGGGGGYYGGGGGHSADPGGGGSGYINPLGTGTLWQATADGPGGVAHPRHLAGAGAAGPTAGNGGNGFVRIWSSPT